MKCPDCEASRKMEPEVVTHDDPEVGGEIRLNVSVAMVCVECGAEMMVGDIETERTFEHDHEDCDVAEFEAEVVGEIDVDVKIQKRVKVIAYECDVHITCSCGWGETIEFADSMPVSHMDEA